MQFVHDFVYNLRCHVSVLVSFGGRVLDKYYVGELIDNEMPVYAEDKYVQLPLSLSL